MKLFSTRNTIIRSPLSPLGRVGVGLLLIFFASCGSGGASDKKTELESLKKQEAELKVKILAIEKELSAANPAENLHIKTVSLASVTTGAFAHFIEVQGKVDADENIAVSAKMGGVVNKIYAKTGDEVKQGQILAELDNGVIVQGIEELKSGLAFSTNLFAKQKNLWDQKIGSEVQYLTAKNQKESLERKLATMNEQLEMSQLKSPINGMVDAVDIKLGQALMPGMPAIRVVNMKSLKVKGDVAESYAGKIKKGNDVIIEFPDLRTQVASKIQFAGRVINPLSRTFGIEAKLDDNNEYHPNMIAVIKVIDYKNDSALIVPLNVIQNGEEGAYLFISKKDGTKLLAKKLNVKTGLVYNGQTEILSGLSAGDELIVRGFQDLNDGEQIQK